MAEDLTVSGAHPLGERSAGVPARLEELVPVDSFAGKVEVRWALEEAVTPLGQLPFFVDSLKQVDLFDPFVWEAPPGTRRSRLATIPTTRCARCPRRIISSSRRRWATTRRWFRYGDSCPATLRPSTIGSPRAFEDLVRSGRRHDGMR